MQDCKGFLPLVYFRLDFFCIMWNKIREPQSRAVKGARSYCFGGLFSIGKYDGTKKKNHFYSLDSSSVQLAGIEPGYGRGYVMAFGRFGGAGSKGGA